MGFSKKQEKTFCEVKSFSETKLCRKKSLRKKTSKSFAKRKNICERKLLKVLQENKKVKLARQNEN
jgi:hypothetical protein